MQTYSMVDYDNICIHPPIVEPFDQKRRKMITKLLWFRLNVTKAETEWKQKRLNQMKLPITWKTDLQQQLKNT